MSFYLTLPFVACAVSVMTGVYGFWATTTRKKSIVPSEMETVIPYSGFRLD